MAYFTVIIAGHLQRGHWQTREEAEAYLANPPSWLNLKDAKVRRITCLGDLLDTPAEGRE